MAMRTPDWLSSDPGLWIEVGGTAAISVLLHVLAFAKRKSQSTAAVLFGLAVLMAIFSGVLLATDGDRASRWRWLLCSLPAIILVGHAGFLHYVRSSVVPVDTAQNRERAMKLLGGSSAAQATYRKLIQMGGRYFSLEVLVLRYVVPALFVFAIAYGVSNALVRWYEVEYYYNGCDPAGGRDSLCYALNALISPDTAPSTRSITTLPSSVMYGAALGLGGAYVYVMLYLGRRAFRLDITPGAATWCAVTLAVGPVLAGLLGPYVLGSGSAWTNVNDFERAALLFVAGSSPKFIVAVLDRTVRRLFAEDAHRSLPPRTIPINQVRGITKDIEERLSEEGIEDTTQLAMCDPYRLLRNTAFDKRQIVRWIDSALFMTYLPDAYVSLERQGVIGAMSLAWYADPDRQDALEGLAAEAMLATTMLRDIVKRLSEDRQLQQVQVLYHLLDLDDGDERGATEAGQGPTG